MECRCSGNVRWLRDPHDPDASPRPPENVLPPAVGFRGLLFSICPPKNGCERHPATIEVRFRHPQFVHDFTRDSIRQAFRGGATIPSFPARQQGLRRGKSAVMGLRPSCGGRGGHAGQPARAVIPVDECAGPSTSRGAILNQAAALRARRKRFQFERRHRNHCPTNRLRGLRNDFPTVLPLCLTPLRNLQRGWSGRLAASASESQARVKALSELKPLGQ